MILASLEKISSDIGFPYTMEGRLLGHVSMSAMMVQEAAGKGKSNRNRKASSMLLTLLFYHTMVNRKKVRRLHVQRKKALLCIMLMKLMRL